MEVSSSIGMLEMAALNSASENSTVGGADMGCCMGDMGWERAEGWGEAVMMGGADMGVSTW